MYGSIVRMPTALSTLELLTLVAIARLGDGAYGVTIRQEIMACSGRDVSIPAVYAAVDRLERAGFARRWLSEARPERGGRARRCYTLSAAGRQRVLREREDALRMWSTVPLRKGGDK